MSTTNDQLVQRLRTQLGDEQIITDITRRELLSTDFYAAGETCAAIIRPVDTTSLAAAAADVTGAGYALIPRGGGMSYTGGYTPDTPQSVVVDLSGMQDIIAINAEDMTVTVQAGTTWESIYEELKPLSLRLPFFGTFSGRLATVGGGLSNGAVFFGSARYGSAAENVLGLEIVCANGRVIRTGQAGFDRGSDFYRCHGPDLTGLFLHDGGALGIKTAATFRLIESPRSSAGLSFAFADAGTAAGGLSAITRAGLAEEAYVFDPHTTARSFEATDLRGNLQRLGKILTGQDDAVAGLKAGARVALAGKRVVPKDAYSLHMICAGRSEAAVDADMTRCREIVAERGGQEIPNSIPLAVRAAPFDNLNGVLGPDGERWAALNAKVPHSDAPAIIEGFEALLGRFQTRLQELDVTVSTLYVAMDTHIFSFETVFHWRDRWLPPHRDVPDATHLASLTEPAADPAATALVAELRQHTLQLFSELGAASNQLGRTYPYRDNLETGACQLIDALENYLDPDGLMNPGVLGRRHS
ncbi:MAG: FAD-binding oxidoreductase [Gammaproteobacteria bacterium]|nr:FAD-binding oxidoreductase [Gammaproteobacteria bacterium]